MRRVSARDARRLLLGGQGLCEDPARPATDGAVRALLDVLGFVQVDSVRVVERAHHLTLGARLDGYRPAMLDALLERDRAVFEHWTHDASIIPAAWYRFWKPRFGRFAAEARTRSWWRERFGAGVRRAMKEIRSRVEAGESVSASTFPRPRGRSGGWWDWSPHKAAMEVLWRCGELAVTRRERFQKIYDLPRRVFPEGEAAPAPGREEHLEWACSTALERLGSGTAAEIAAFWGAVGTGDADRWAAAAVAEGRAEAVEIAGEDGSRVAGFAVPGRVPPVPPAGLRILNPFDPVVRDRDRLERLFGFRYRFEAYTPAAKRVHGYYVLPILEGERFTGRLDAKFDREAGVLRVNGIWWEPGVERTRRRRAGLEDALGKLAERIGAAGVGGAAGPRPAQRRVFLQARNAKA